MPEESLKFVNHVHIYKWQAGSKPGTAVLYNASFSLEIKVLDLIKVGSTAVGMDSQVRRPLGL